MDERLCVNPGHGCFPTWLVGQGRREIGKQSKNASLAAGPQASQSRPDVAEELTNRAAGKSVGKFHWQAPEKDVRNKRRLEGQMGTSHTEGHRCSQWLSAPLALRSFTFEMSNWTCLSCLRLGLETLQNSSLTSTDGVQVRSQGKG